MFKMFTSPKKETNTSYPKEVLEIHHEFETASDKLLKEANDIINSQPVFNIPKINILKSLGFIQVKEVLESTKILAKTELSKEQIELVNYYKHNYPFNKFIPEEQVKNICHKYNLVCGDVSIFKGFVPEKNVNEIIRFKLKPNEENIISFTVRSVYSDNPNVNIIGKSFSCENAEIKKEGKYFHIFKKGYSEQYAYQSEEGLEFYSKDTYDIFGLKHLGEIRFRVDNKLKICAPVKDMDISGLRLIDGYKLEKYIPDPVVLQPVKGGYLILTAWGDEASDELVVNSINN